jgi:hypothetical protein
MDAVPAVVMGGDGLRRRSRADDARHRPIAGGGEQEAGTMPGAVI